VAANLRVDRASVGDTEPEMSFEARGAGAAFSGDSIEHPPLWVAGVSYTAAALFGLMAWGAVIWWCL
jgi:hypothetical protein